jgi:hypothetical protein
MDRHRICCIQKQGGGGANITASTSDCLPSLSDDKQFHHHLIGLGPFCPGYAEHQTNLKHV